MSSPRAKPGGMGTAARHPTWVQRLQCHPTAILAVCLPGRAPRAADTGSDVSFLVGREKGLHVQHCNQQGKMLPSTRAL